MRETTDSNAMTKHLTPGQRALREAARLEAALVYGGIRMPVASPASVSASVAEAELRARARHEDHAIVTALRRGYTVSELVNRHGLPYERVRAAQKKLMKETA